MVNINTLGDTSFAGATPETMKTLLDAHYAGDLSIYDYWGIEDERLVSMGGDISQVVQMVITDREFYLLENGKPAAFVVDQKNVLKDIRRPMNEKLTNRGGWAKCDMRTWCNREYANAFPKDIEGLFKLFYTEGKIVDQFALHSEYEIFGEIEYSREEEAEGSRQLEYYKKTRNRIKCYGDDYGNARWYWERSPYSGTTNYFCAVGTAGYASYSTATNPYGIAPFGCL